MSAFTLSPKTVDLLRVLLTPSIVHYAPGSGTVQIDWAGLDGALATAAPAERAAFTDCVKALSAGGVALLATGSADASAFAVPWVTLSQAARQSPAGAFDVAQLLGLAPGAADPAATLRARHPNVPAWFLDPVTLGALASAKPRPEPRIALSDIEAVAQCLLKADYSGLEGHWYLAPIGFSITLGHDCAAKVANLLLGAGGGGAFTQALETAASKGVSAALKAVVASAGTVLELIAAALGENINLVNGPSGCRIECTWPYTGGLFFWADSVDDHLPPTVGWVGPDAGASLGGRIQLTAQGAGVAAIDFSASYATNPADSATVAWHPLGRGTSGPANTWSLVWDSSAVPSQSDPGRGLVNLCAIGVDSDGNELGQAVRDYRLVGLHNAARMTCATTPPVVPLNRPVAVTVNAFDAQTNARLSGSVSIDGQVVGTTGEPFTHTFVAHVTTHRRPFYQPGPNGKPVQVGFTTTVTTAYPVGSVAVAGYQPGSTSFGLHTSVVTTAP